VQPLTPGQAARLPLHLLPPHRLRVLSPLQGLQIAVTLALESPQRAERLCRLATLAADDDTRLTLRVLVLTLLSRCPARLELMPPPARRLALEDLWSDPLLACRWQRLALRLDDAGAGRLLVQARRQGCLGKGWRALDDAVAVDGWDLPPTAPPRRRLESAHDRRRLAAAAPGLAVAVLGHADRRQPADAAAATAAIA
jgi:hypothetical protein